jgi:hypothetical protein
MRKWDGTGRANAWDRILDLDSHNLVAYRVIIHSIKESMLQPGGVRKGECRRPRVKKHLQDSLLVHFEGRGAAGRIGKPRATAT